jgi:hypothetical protein
MIFRHPLWRVSDSFSTRTERLTKSATYRVSTDMNLPGMIGIGMIGLNCARSVAIRFTKHSLIKCLTCSRLPISQTWPRSSAKSDWAARVSSSSNRVMIFASVFLLLVCSVLRRKTQGVVCSQPLAFTRQSQLQRHCCSRNCRTPTGTSAAMIVYNRLSQILCWVQRVRSVA